MNELLAQTPSHWSWWVLAIVLTIIEMFAPGFFFIWLGASAGLVGVAVYFDPALSWQTQVLAFAVLSVVSVLAWRSWFRRRPEVSDHPTLNRRAEQYVGRTFELVAPIVNGRGRVHIGDTVWSVEGPDLPTNTRVRVTSVKDGVLQVEAADSGNIE